MNKINLKPAADVADASMSVKLISGCGLELMKSMPDASTDLILTDPPYYSTNLAFDKEPRIDYAAWLKECMRILKPAGVLASFADFNLLAELRSYKVFKSSYEIIWQKTMASGFLDANIRPLRAHEYIGIFTNALKKSTYSPQKTLGKAYARLGRDCRMAHTGQMRSTASTSEGERYPHSVIRFSNSNSGSVHPTQKPLDLCEWLIKTYSKEGDIVFDGFMGVGSTGIAAKNLNRRFIGAELSAGYFEIAKRRIAAASL